MANNGRYVAAISAVLVVAPALYMLAAEQLRALSLAISAVVLRSRAILYLMPVVGFVVSNVLFLEKWSDRDPLYGLFVREFIKGPPGLSTNVRTPQPTVRADPSPLRPRPLVLIVVDAIVSDRDLRGTMPFLEKYLTAGKLQSRGPAIPICTYSFCGITGILSSKYWGQLHRPPLTISDELARYGYRSYYLMSGNHRCFFNMRSIYGPNIAYFVDEQDGASGHTANDLDLLQHLNGLKLADPDRSFVYIHLESVHALGWREQVGGGIKALAMQALLGGGRKAGETAYRQQYAAGLRQADYVIEQTFVELSKQKLLSRALVIITGDHGERLGEVSRFGHGGAPDRQVAQVPFLIFDPLAESYPERPMLSIVDLAPTLLQSIGVPTPADWSGVPLQREISDRALAIDSEDTIAVVAQVAGRKTLFRCAIATGRTDIQALDDAEDPVAISYAAINHRMAELLKTLPRRRDAGRCARLYRDG